MSKGTDKPKDHVVVTRAAPVKEGGRVIVHTYGPFTKDMANHHRKKILMDAEQLGYAWRLEVSACRMLDPELASG